jgi:hypothetical protein
MRLKPIKDTTNTVLYLYPTTDNNIVAPNRKVRALLGLDASAQEFNAEGRVYKPQRTPEQMRLFPPLFNIRNGPLAPDDAYVSIRYRNQVFWIDDRDQQSKSMFNSLLLLFSLTETGQSQAAPLVTIPTR